MTADVTGGRTGGGPVGGTEVGALLSRLDGLEVEPLAAQAAVLDAVRRGLDEVLTRPVSDG